MTDNLIERLEERKKLKYMAPSKMDGGQQLVSIDDLYETVDALKAKDAEIERLKEALKPFADWPVLEAYNDDNYVDCAFQTGHFRAARKALGGRDAADKHREKDRQWIEQHGWDEHG